MNLKFDWDDRKHQAILSGDLFDEIREHFSVHNEAAKFARGRGRFLPSRTYVITPAGRFDLGMYEEIKKYLLTNQYKVAGFVAARSQISNSQAVSKTISKGCSEYMSREWPGCCESSHWRR